MSISFWLPWIMLLGFFMLCWGDAAQCFVVIVTGWGISSEETYFSAGYVYLLMLVPSFLFLWGVAWLYLQHAITLKHKFYNNNLLESNSSRIMKSLLQHSGRERWRWLLIWWENWRWQDKNLSTVSTCTIFIFCTASYFLNNKKLIYYVLI